MNAGDVIQSRYRLEEPLGKGGMATVWRAHDLRLERAVALKFLMAPLTEDPTFLVRFFAEAQQVAKLSHPNVIRVLDFGEGGECPYLAMEFVPGGSLDAVTGEPMLPERAVHLISGAARGAGAAHEAGLIHRDLKPGNIMLGDGDIPKLADFGIAVTQAQERFTATGMAIGSPHYVSPEQASGRPVEPASDIYSLGVVLYELLTGHKPFEADNATALAIAHVEKEPEPPSVHNPDLSPALDAVVMTCLAKDPRERFRTGDELAAALDAALIEEDTAAFAAIAAPGPAIAEDHDASWGPNGGRIATVAVMAALFLGLLAFGVTAMWGPDQGPSEDRASAAAEPSEPEQTPKVPNSTPTDPDDDASDDAGIAASPSPTETDEEDDERDTARKPSTSGASNNSGNDTGRDTDNEDADATPEPTEEPTTEPTSEPSSEPEPEPTSSP